MNSGVALWNKAKKIIPGGNQLLSKRAEMFLPGHWPAYYKKAKGVNVWDMDGKKYTDMSIMGIGTCVLGYANKELVKAVTGCIKNGSMNTFNCHEEVELAEKLIELHPWSQMVRFARTGGEATTMAVRIGRAASGKDKVAFCGYHGWHDWYMATNLVDDKNLNAHLLAGLSPSGVPKALTGTTLPFRYGNIEEFRKIIADNKGQIGVIIMEVFRAKDVDTAFINEIRKTATEIGAVLIFDEVTSGFRLKAGGLHTLYNLQPDIVVLAKAMGGGHPIAAVIGKKEVMEAAQGSFISSSYWTERVGYVAALEVIRQYEKYNVAKHLVETGTYLRTKLAGMFSSYDFKADMTGMPAAPIVAIGEDNPLVVKTVFTQEMLKKGYLASNLTYVSLAHTKEIADKYVGTAGKVIKNIKKAIKKGNLESMLEGPVCHSGFQRLT